MRRLLTAAVLCVLLSNCVGCFPIYSGDPPRRTQQLLFTSENFRMFLDEWERFWFLDQPDHEGPLRVHGGII